MVDYSAALLDGSPIDKDGWACAHLQQVVLDDVPDDAVLVEVAAPPLCAKRLLQIVRVFVGRERETPK